MQVVPDVAPGFHVPEFYKPFIAERREEVRVKVERLTAERQPPARESLDASRYDK